MHKSVTPAGSSRSSRMEPCFLTLVIFQPTQYPCKSLPNILNSKPSQCHPGSSLNFNYPLAYGSGGVIAAKSCHIKCLLYMDTYITLHDVTLQYHARSHTSIHTYMHAYIHTYLLTCITCMNTYASMPASTNASMHACMSCMYVCMSCTHVGILVCKHVCMYACMHPPKKERSPILSAKPCD